MINEQLTDCSLFNTKTNEEKRLSQTVPQGVCFTFGQLEIWKKWRVFMEGKIFDQKSDDSFGIEGIDDRRGDKNVTLMDF